MSLSIVELPGFPAESTGGDWIARRPERARHIGLVAADIELMISHGVTGPHLMGGMSASTRGSGSARTEEQIQARLLGLLTGPACGFYESIEAARIIAGELVVEFRATGYPGSFLHRIGVGGSARTRHQVIPVMRSDLVRVTDIGAALIEQLRRAPRDLHKLSPRKFEVFVAGVVEAMGYEVELTQATRDEGVDIFALKREGLAPVLTVIDCKRYHPSKRIGPGLVTAMAGLRQRHSANQAMVVTSAWFTDGARNLQQSKFPFEVSLADQARLIEWLMDYGWSDSGEGFLLPGPSASEP